MKPIIQLPKEAKPHAGLFKSRNRWCATYYVNNSARYKVLCDEAASIDEAVKLQGEFYAELMAIGATRKGEPKEAGWGSYIHRRKPYTVKVQGHFIGDFETITEAMAARNEYLANR